MTHQEFAALSAAHARVAERSVGATAVALYVCGGQGTYSRVFRVVRLPKEAFARETLGGRASRRLLAYARRKGCARGFNPRNGFGAIPVAWLDGGPACEAFAW